MIEKTFRDLGSDCVRKFMKEGNYILIIGILIAACIALYKGLDLNFWNVFWIFFTGLMIYGAIATITKKW